MRFSTIGLRGIGLLLAAVSASPAAGPLAFEKHVLTDQYYCDGINAGDINRDGRPDIVAGPFWFEGPDFQKKHEFYPAVALEPATSPSNSLFSWVYDFNRDGWPDILVLGRVHLHPAYWYENPRGGEGLWKKHYVFERIQGETPPFADLNQDGRPELICHWENRWGYVAPDWNRPDEPWSFHPITAKGDYDQFYHGTGVGDINGDGRTDVLLNEGWWEQPATGSNHVEWTAHPFRFAKRGGAQMYAYDVDGDGDNDVITALDAHGWGLAWFEQVRRDGQITFVQHTIMEDHATEAKYGVAFSQPHAIDMADIDGDGLKDIIVGKRRWAHGPNKDIEPGAAPVLYWFQLERRPDGVHFRPHLVDNWSGVGLQVVAVDATGDGVPDILTASKLGSVLFVTKRGSVATR
jgi:hypothetical protein